MTDQAFAKLALFQINIHIHSTRMSRAIIVYTQSLVWLGGEWSPSQSSPRYSILILPWLVVDGVWCHYEFTMCEIWISLYMHFISVIQIWLCHLSSKVSLCSDTEFYFYSELSKLIYKLTGTWFPAVAWLTSYHNRQDSSARKSSL